MSLTDFRRALCDMTLDPIFAASVLRNGPPALNGYELRPIEQKRLVGVVHQPGMSVNCTLARANRFAPIADAFPLTCCLLKPQLRELLDELWSVHRPRSDQLSGEPDAFEQFLRGKISRGELDHPYVAEIFRYDCAVWELVQTLRDSTFEGVCDRPAERYATVRFEHDPRILVPYLERDEAPPAELPAGDYEVSLILRGDTLDVDMKV